MLAFDLSHKTGRRVLVLKQQAAEKWIVTGDMPVTAPTTGLGFVGTSDGEEEGDPTTTCYSGSKKVQALGFLKVSKRRFDQPTGALAWTVDTTGKPTAVTKLVCRF